MLFLFSTLLLYILQLFYFTNLTLMGAGHNSINYQQTLLVATLNYGGILSSPFEFFSNQEPNSEQVRLSNNFRKLMPTYFKDFDNQNAQKFKWNVGKIDKDIQKARYTPIYREDAGIENNELISQQSFQRRWNQEFNKALQELGQKGKDAGYKQQQKKAMRTFDLICYHSILNYVNKKDLQKEQLNDLEELDQQTMKNLNKNQDNDVIGKYRALMKSFFERSYLSQELKIEKLMQVFDKNFHSILQKGTQLEKKNYQKNVDVFFFQEPTKVFIEALKSLPNFQEKYYLNFKQSKEQKQQKCAIVIRKESFPYFFNNKSKQLIERQLAQQLQQLKRNQFLKDFESNIQETTLLVIDSYIFLGVHLSSKKDKNLQQVNAMKHTLIQLQKNGGKYHVILGGDINSYVSGEGIEDYIIFPKYKQFITNRKKRTYMQPQFNKANQLNQQCKDHIITSLHAIKRGILTIDLKRATSESLLPTSEHPFDHFMVACLLQKAIQQKKREQRQKKQNQ